MNFLEYVEYLREAKEKEFSQKEINLLPFDAKKVAEALKTPWNKNNLNKRELDTFDDFRNAFSRQVIDGVKLKEFTEQDKEVFELLGFKVGGKKIDGEDIIYTTYSK